jgi:uncharacterized pyridoxamine 5'-phosphate oxidase family protein
LAQLSAQTLNGRRAVHESSDDLLKLQTLLDESYDSAGPHLRAILTPAGRLSAFELVQELVGVNVLHLATVSSSGHPLVAPVDGLFFRGSFWFGSAENSMRFRHIRRDSRVSGSFAKGEVVTVLVRGVAQEVDKTLSESEAFREYNREVYGAEWDSWEYWSSNPYAKIVAERLFASRVGPGVSG